MENEIDRLKQAKMYMEYLANGVDPVHNTDVDDGTLHNEQVIECFRYISDILTKNIYEAETAIKEYDEFYITEEQCKELNVYPYNRMASEIAKEINRFVAVNGTRKLPATWINDWLEAEGYLCKSDLKSRIASDKGKQLGITYEYRKSDKGKEYYINLYNEQAQRFIFNNINEIVDFRNNRFSLSNDDIQYIDYPANMSIREFIQQHTDKCFIVATGGCDAVSHIGSCIAVLIYKGNNKVLKKSNIQADSSVKCILTGVLDAASAIKLPTDVIILSSTPLGFNTPRSKNYKLCHEIYRILSEKGCQISYSVCQGKGYELNSFVKSLSTT